MLTDFDFTENEFIDFKHDNRCFEMLKHEDKLFTTRVNLLLIAESLLFLSFTNVLTSSLHDIIRIIISATIILIGLAITISIGYINIRAYKHIIELKRAIGESFSFYRKIGLRRAGSANAVLSKGLSIIFCFAWVVFSIILVLTIYL